MKNIKDKKIEELYNQCSDLAIERIEEIARDILKKHPKLDEYCQGMGTWDFTDKKGNLIDNDNPICKSLDDFMQEWDSYLHLTGAPMRFTAISKKITDW
jgi:hypothetical protein